VFARDENLVVQPFDLERLELTGSPKPIAAGVHWDANRAALGMGLSARGTLVYPSVVRATTYRLAWIFVTDANQTSQRFISFPFGGGAPTDLLPGEPGFEQSLGSITPDGRTLPFTRRPLRDRIDELMTLDLEGQQPPRPT
jgi:hypothetical protein